MKEIYYDKANKEINIRLLFINKKPHGFFLFLKKIGYKDLEEFYVPKAKMVKKWETI